MVKYGKEFRQSQKSEWKEKYLDYKALKKLIKKYVNDIDKKGMSDGKTISAKKSFADTRKSLLAEQIDNFIEILNKEIKKFYILYTKEEKELYKQINSHLYQKEDYKNYNYDEFLPEIEELRDISKKSFQLSEFAFLNIKALMKILKKFDKKIVGNYKKYLLKEKYIQSKLEEQNSDLFYIYTFKLIDETSVLLEDLVKALRSAFDKSKRGEENEDDTVNFGAAEGKIKENIQKVDEVNQKVKTILRPWENSLQIASKLSTKLLVINKENNNEAEVPSGGHNDSYLSILNNLSVENGENNNSNIMNNITTIYHKKNSVLENIYVSKENRNNVYLILIHVFCFMFSYAVAIPSSIDIVQKLKYPDYFAIIMLTIGHLGTLFSGTYIPIISSKKTKSPLIFSIFILITGHFVYGITEKFDSIYLLFLGRFMVGMGSNRVPNKTYLTKYVPTQKVKQFLLYFHIASILGESCGFLVCGIAKGSSFEGYKDITKNNIGVWIMLGVWSFLFFLSLFCFKEANSSSFRISDIAINGGLGNPLLYEKGKKRKRGKTSPTGKEITLNESIRQETMMIEDINKKLGAFNEENQYDDPNLVRKSITLITKKEKKKLNYLASSFRTFLISLFSFRFINEILITLTPYYFLPEKNESECLSAYMLSLGTFLIIIFEICLSKRKICCNDKPLLIILPLFCLIACGTMTGLAAFNNKIIYTSLMFTLLIFGNYGEKIASNIFNKIIPSSYSVCAVEGNIVINIFSNFGKIFGSFIIIAIFPLDIQFGIYLIFGTASFMLSLTLFVIICNYADLRIKAMSRILEGQGNVNTTFD